MTPEMSQKIRCSILKHEGFTNYLYEDTVGKQTIGYGYNVTDRGIATKYLDAMYEDDVNFFYHQLLNFSWFHELNSDRQIVLIDMCFMGFKKFLSFKRMINALEKHDYKRASEEMLDSKWAEQVKGRAAALAMAMQTGVYLM